MNDVSSALMAKSDQLNADDLLGGSIVIEITKVTNLGKGKEQPLILNYKNDDGKPWKPCKSMGRVLAQAWQTTDGNKWIGRKVRLYRDDKVRQLDGTIGAGTRIAHKDSLSHIDKPMDIIITVSRGKKAPYRVEPLTITASTTKPTPTDADKQNAAKKKADAIIAEIQETDDIAAVIEKHQAMLDRFEKAYPDLNAAINTALKAREAVEDDSGDDVPEFLQ